MDNKPKTSPKDFFLHLGVIIALYVSAIALLNLLFQTADYAFPDALGGYGDPYSSGIRIAVATLIIIFPLFLLLSWLSGKGYKTEPAKRELSIRKWLLYLTLFAAGLAVVIDLVALVQTFLSGEITSRFALKVLSVIVVAGGIFGYYLYDLKRNAATESRGRFFACIAAIIVLVSLVGGFVIMGSPATARAKRFDDRRVSDLQNIEWQIVNFWQQKGALPKQLSDLEDSINGYRVPTDPENSNTGYEYFPGEGTSFKLCASFSRSNTGEENNLKGRGAYGYDSSAPMAVGPYGGPDGLNGTWQHEKGRRCFDRKIDQQLYPTKAKPMI